MDDNVTPIRPTAADYEAHFTRRAAPMLVDPPAHSDEWLGGWKACQKENAQVLDSALARARQSGFDAGMHINPSWLDLCVISCLMLIVGFLVAVACFA